MQWGSRRSAPPPSHANPGVATGFTPPRPPLLAATWPPKPPLSPRCSPKAQQSCKVPPGSRDTGGSLSHSPRQVPAVGFHSPTRLPPGWLSLSRWPRGPCLPPMLFSSSSSSRPFSPCCKKKTLTSTRGEQSQVGNRGSTLSYRFWWLCCFSTKNKKSGRVEKFKTGRKMLLFSPARCLAENKQPGWGQRGLAASQAGGSRQLDARKQTQQRKAPSDPPAGVPSAYVLRAELKCIYTLPRADPLAQSEDSPLKLGPVWAGYAGSASSVKAALKGLIWISQRNRGRGGAGFGWQLVGLGSEQHRGPCSIPQAGSPAHSPMELPRDGVLLGLSIQQHCDPKKVPPLLPTTLHLCSHTLNTQRYPLSIHIPPVWEGLE